LYVKRLVLLWFQKCLVGRFLQKNLGFGFDFVVTTVAVSVVLHVNAKAAFGWQLGFMYHAISCAM